LKRPDRRRAQRDFQRDLIFEASFILRDARKSGLLRMRFPSW
jgi:hypothetical protein